MFFRRLIGVLANPSSSEGESSNVNANVHEATVQHPREDLFLMRFNSRYRRGILFVSRFSQTFAKSTLKSQPAGMYDIFRSLVI